MVPTAAGPTWASAPQGRLLLEPEHQAFWPSDAPSTLRTVGADCLCACAGPTCAEASLRNKSGQPYGGCRREQVGPPPWHNFSSAYVADFTTDPSNGSLVATLRPRRSLWYGLPRPVWPNCSKNDGEPQARACTNSTHPLIRGLRICLNLRACEQSMRPLPPARRTQAHQPTHEST